MFNYFAEGSSPVIGFFMVGLVGGASLYFFYKTSGSTLPLSNGFSFLLFCPNVVISEDKVFYYNAIYALLLLILILRLLLRRNN